MIKCAVSFSIRMAGITFFTLINITLNPLMFIIRISLIVFMTSDTRENRKITLISMAISAIIPLPIVFTTVYREVLSIVIKICRRPSTRCMTILTGSWEARSNMIWINRIFIILLVACITIRWCSSVSIRMTLLTINC